MGHTAAFCDGLTVKETAEKLSLHPETVRRLIREEKIKATRSFSQPGHGFVIAPSEIARIKRDGITYSG